MSEKLLLGYNSGISKKGNPYCKLTIGFPYSDAAVAKGFVGFNVQDKFANVKVAEQLTPDMIMKKIDLTFGCNDNGFPEINSVKVVK